MTKEEFKNWAATAANLDGDEWRDEFEVEVKKFDPELAKLVHENHRTYAAIRDYCKAKFSG